MRQVVKSLALTIGCPLHCQRSMSVRLPITYLSLCWACLDIKTYNKYVNTNHNLFRTQKKSGSFPYSLFVFYFFFFLWFWWFSPFPNQIMYFMFCILYINIYSSYFECGLHTKNQSPIYIFNIQCKMLCRSIVNIMLSTIFPWMLQHMYIYVMYNTTQPVKI